VHEETQVSPEWGDPMTPDIVAALRDHKLLPIAELDRGFVRPTYESQVIVSYYQAGRICDWIQEHWGMDKIMEMVKLFAVPRSTVDTIQTVLGLTPEQFDSQFQEWLYNRDGETAKNFDDWRKRLGELVAAARAHRPEEVLREGEGVIALYPDYVYEGNVYELLAQTRLDAGDTKGASDVLLRYVHRGGRNPQVLERLAKLQQDAGDGQAAAATLDRINWIDPVYSAGVHRQLGDLWLTQGNTAGAVREFKSVLAMKPQDQAQAHYDLARAQRAAGNHSAAEDEVFAALEVAPGFRPAQKLLLELQDQNSSPGPSQGPPQGQSQSPSQGPSQGQSQSQSQGQLPGQSPVQSRGRS
jgi:tetratricopeptide (TPR) repeat protein